MPFPNHQMDKLVRIISPSDGGLVGMQWKGIFIYDGRNVMFYSCLGKQFSNNYKNWNYIYYSTQQLHSWKFIS